MVLALFGVGSIAHAQLLSPVDTIDITVGTTTHRLTFPTETLRSAQSRLQEVLFYLRAFDSSAVINVTQNDEPATSVYTDISNLAFETEESIKSTLDTIRSIADGCYLFQGSFQIGDQNPEIREIQRFLNRFPETRVAEEGPGSPGEETEYFGSRTFAAIFALQAKYADQILKPLQLDSPSGYWGAATRGFVNTLTGCTN